MRDLQLGAQRLGLAVRRVVGGAEGGDLGLGALAVGDALLVHGLAHRLQLGPQPLGLRRRAGGLRARGVGGGFGGAHAGERLHAGDLGGRLGGPHGRQRFHARRLGDGLGGGSRRQCLGALGLGGGKRGERLLALLVGRLGGELGLLDALAQDARALDDVLEAGCPIRRVVVGGGPAGGLVGETGGLGCGLARGLALLVHAAIDVLARERRRVDVADDDQDACKAGVRVGLAAAAHDALDRLERMPVAQAQLLRMPGAGVTRTQLGQQRGELPAERERHRHDHEAQRADGARRGAGGERARGDRIDAGGA